MLHPESPAVDFFRTVCGKMELFLKATDKWCALGAKSVSVEGPYLEVKYSVIAMPGSGRIHEAVIWLRHEDVLYATELAKDNKFIGFVPEAQN
jgi:hypothetical protein